MPLAEKDCKKLAELLVKTIFNLDLNKAFNNKADEIKALREKELNISFKKEVLSELNSAFDLISEIQALSELISNALINVKDELEDTAAQKMLQLLNTLYNKLVEVHEYMKPKRDEWWGQLKSRHKYFEDKFIMIYLEYLIDIALSIKRKEPFTSNSRVFGEHIIKKDYLLSQGLC